MSAYDPLRTFALLAHSQLMQVLVIFEQAYTGDPLDAVWIIGSPENRRWFNRHLEGIDPNSAVFSPSREPIHIIWQVLEHHPTWTEVVITGMAPNSELTDALRSDTVLHLNHGDGFRLKRR